MLCFPFKNCKSSLSKKTWESNYIPNYATQQDIFISKYPSCDGRGIKIAIIDTGLDVSLNGLQLTSEGLPKIIDCFDFTGNGDVDTSVVREVDSKNLLVGLSGKKFKIPSKWKNPSGKWHLGRKSLFKPNKIKTTKKLPKIDCIVWFDGVKWCACIETSGDLEKAKVLTNFRDDHEYSILCLEGLKMTYCVTIHENGNLLEIFMPCDHHGSVVAQVAAAHFPQQSESDGLAPGAQLIFMAVTDPDKRHALNLQALKKALLKCIEMKVDIANYSICSFDGNEEITKIIREMANVHNILIFKGAGNSGPFYSSIYKCDKNVEDVIFTVGAALTPEMKKRIYNVSSDNNKNNNTTPTVLYPFSSRGPGAWTSRGLDFIAPGAAITEMPRFNLSKFNAFEGTSYSSPNAAAAVACLLSALKQCSIKYSPKSIKFVLTKTAALAKNQNKFEFGHGIIQISDAFDFYCYHKNIDYSKVLTSIPAAGGIYFIQDDEDNEIMEREIDLSKFIEIQPGKAIAEKWTLEVSPETAEAFIELPSQLDENNKFKIRASTKNLEAGSLNFAEVSVIDPVIGSVYNICVNVMRILRITDTHNNNFQKQITLNNENAKHLLFYPSFESCKKCDIKITALDAVATVIAVQYIIQHKAKINFEEAEKTKKLLQFTPKNQTQIYSMPTENEMLHEICIYQLIGASSNVKFHVEFIFKDESYTLTKKMFKQFKNGLCGIFVR